MEIITWNSSYSVKIKEIDSQHKQLVNLINSLYKEINSNKIPAELNDVLNSLTDYTIKHFSTEEELMMKYDYPDFSIHKNEHEKLVNDLKQFRIDYVIGKVSLPTDIAEYLKDWLTSHIMETDKKLGEFLNKLGIY